MYCSKCGSSIHDQSKYCPGCGKQVHQKSNKLMLSMIIMMSLICIGVFGYLGMPFIEEEPVKQAASEKVVKTQVEKTETKPEAVQVTKTKIIEKAAPSKDVSAIIESAQPKVYTIFSDYGQGSGFLMNKSGDILTNAHVVEGSITVIIRSYDGTEFEGTVIGYSNEVDIAVIRVPDLAGQAPLALESATEAKLGDEVIALGSPRGFENTATLGNISGVNRTFVIVPHTYEGIYQISAPIAPGSSGGPLLDKESEKVIAINSARHNEETNIGFSIPLFKVYSILQGWIQSPMSEEEVTALFYNGEGLYFYQDLYDNEFYFDGGDYSEDYDYYEYPYEEDYSEESPDDTYEEENSDEYVEDSYEEEDYSEDYYYEEEYEEPYTEEIIEENPEEEIPYEEELSEEGMEEFEVEEETPIVEETLPEESDPATETE